LPVTDKERATKQSKKVSTTKTKETNQSKSEKVSTKETKQSKSGSKAAREKVCSGEERIECGRGKRLLICLHERDGSNGRAVCMKENRILDHLRSHPNDYCGRCNQNEVPTSSPSRSPTVSVELINRCICSSFNICSFPFFRLILVRVQAGHPRLPLSR